MLFEGGNNFCGAEHFGEKIQIKRFQRCHAGHAAVDTARLELSGRLHSHRQSVAKRENPSLLAFTKSDRLANRHFGLGLVNNRLPFFADTNINRSRIV